MLLVLRIIDLSNYFMRSLKPVTGLVLSGDDVNLRVLTNLDAVDSHPEISEQDFQAVGPFFHFSV